MEWLGGKPSHKTKSAYAETIQRLIDYLPSSIRLSEIELYLAQVLGNQACRKGHFSLFIRIPRLATDLLQARGDGSYSSYLKKLSKVSVLILDDLGVCPLDDLTKRDLLEIVEDRYGVGSTILTSQLPTEDWFEHLGGAQVADAICDRLLHNCLKYTLVGDSMRKELAQEALTKKERSDT
jgi:DNA replication protein DnaC